MKLITPDCSLLRVGIFGFVLLWGVFALMGLVMWTGVYVLSGSMPFDWRWLGIGPIPFSIYGVKRVLQTERHQRRERSERTTFVQGRHPLLGDFRYHPHSDTWFASIALTAEQIVNFRGRGLSPSDEQITTWSEVIMPHLESILARASSALLPPPEPCSHAENTPLVPDGVELLDGGAFVLSLTAEAISDEIDFWPRARFSADLSLQNAGWVP